MIGQNKRRDFQLVIQASGVDEYGIRLFESNGSSESWVSVTSLRWSRTERILPNLLDAVRQSRLPNSVLNSGRRKPIALEESAGVRLALVLLTTAPLSKWKRVDAVAAGISAMTTEEAYYWYAKCQGPDRRRARRSLRLLLAEE